jgi:hypothetical protein
MIFKRKASPRQKHNNETSSHVHESFKQFDSSTILHILSFIELYIDSHLLALIQSDKQFKTHSVVLENYQNHHQLEIQNVARREGTETRNATNVIDDVIDIRIVEQHTEKLTSGTVTNVSSSRKSSSLFSKISKLFGNESHVDGLTLHKLMIKHLYGRIKSGTYPVLLFQHLVLSDHTHEVSEIRHRINHMNQPALSLDIQRQHVLSMIQSQELTRKSGTFETVVAMISPRSRSAAEKQPVKWNDILFLQIIPSRLSSISLGFSEASNVLLQKFHDTKKLSFFKCSYISRLSGLNLPIIHELDLSGTSVTMTELINTIPRMTNLSTLFLNDLSAEKFDSDSSAIFEFHQILSSHPKLRCLSLDNNLMSGYSITRVLLYENIHKLSFTRMNINLNLYKYIGTNLKNLPTIAVTEINSHLRELDLSDNWDAFGSKFELENVKFIATYLPNITRLNLNRCNITSDGASILLDSTYPISRNLKYLDLSQNSIEGDGLVNIAHTELQTLLLSYNMIGDIGCEYLRNSQIETLYLNKCGISDKGALRLLSNRKLKRIHLRKNNLTDVTLHQFIHSQNKPFSDIGLPLDSPLETPPTPNLSEIKREQQVEHTLQVLDIGYNQHITYHGTRDLPFHTGITFLSLRGNQIGNRGTALLFLIPNLVELDISYVRLLEQAEALRYVAQSRLKLLHMRHCDLKNEGAEILLCSQLQWIDLSHNELTDDFAYSLVKRRSCLEYLNVLCNQFSDRGKETLLRDQQSKSPLLQLFV